MWPWLWPSDIVKTLDASLLTNWTDYTLAHFEQSKIYQTTWAVTAGLTSSSYKMCHIHTVLKYYFPPTVRKAHFWLSWNAVLLMVHDYYCTNPRPKLPQSVVPLQLIMPPRSLCEMQTALMCSKYIIWHFTVLLSISEIFFYSQAVRESLYWKGSCWEERQGCRFLATFLLLYLSKHFCQRVSRCTTPASAYNFLV